MMLRLRATTETEDVVALRRKEQARVRQHRYRQRKLQHEHDLEASIKRLNEEIQALEESREPCEPEFAPEISEARAHAQATSQRFVDCFAFGFAPTSSSPWLPRSRAPKLGKLDDQPREQAQLAFVEEAVDPMVTWGAYCGQNAFLEHWQRYASVCEGFHIDGAGATFQATAFPSHESAEGSSVCLVHARVSLVLSSATIDVLLPMLPISRPELAKSLCGKAVAIPSVFSLEFNASGRVTRFNARLDWISTMLPLLPGLEALAFALNGANLSLAGQIGCEPPILPFKSEMMAAGATIPVTPMPTLQAARALHSPASPSQLQPITAAHKPIPAIMKIPATSTAHKAPPSARTPPQSPPPSPSMKPSPRMKLPFLLTSVPNNDA